jgi:putative ABC transport system permease protein
MLFFEILVVALQSLRQNIMRSILTMLGVIIGVGAVITVVALGEGARASVNAQLEGLGANNLSVRSGRGFGRDHSRGARMTIDDVYELIENSTSIGRVIPELSRNAQLEYKNVSGSSTSVLGTWVGYLEMNNWPLESGRFFTTTEQEGARRLAVIGKEVTEGLFPAYIDPVGQQIRLNGVTFEVIGTLPEKGGSSWFSRDNVVIVPMATAMRRLFGTEYISSMTVEALSEDHVTMAMAEIESVMRRQHRLRPGVENDFSISRQTEFLSVMQDANQTFTLLLGGIAGISLIVGGIGIMNIMLVSVTERTREIGIRKSIGARKSAIQLQFLIEAITLSCMGGVIGIALGYIASDQLGTRFGWQMLVSPDSVMLAFGFSAAIGVVFGFYPARRASLLDPIEALRYD